MNRSSCCCCSTFVAWGAEQFIALLTCAASGVRDSWEAMHGWQRGHTEQHEKQWEQERQCVQEQKSPVTKTIWVQEKAYATIL